MMLRIYLEEDFFVLRQYLVALEVIFTGLVAEKVAEIVVREFNLKNIDKWF